MDIKADIMAATDGGEDTALMEPLLVGATSHHRGPLADLAVELAARAAGFRRSLPEGVRSALADLVRAMNCYYSNLIEGHDTHPVDIERALRNDYRSCVGWIGRGRNPAVYEQRGDTCRVTPLPV